MADDSSLAYPSANNESSEVGGYLHDLLPVTYFNVTLRPGLIMPQTSDDSLFATRLIFM